MTHSSQADPYLRYWTWEGLHRFMLDNDLVIAEGMEDDDEMAITRKGEELFAVLAVILRLGGGVPR